MREITYAEALREALREEMLRDKRVFLIGEDIGLHGNIFGVTKGLVQEFGPQRVRCTPISEAAIVGAAVGAAVTGTRPVAEIMYIDFTTLAMDQIVNQGAKIRYMFGGKARVPLVLRTQGGDGRGNAAQHHQSLEAWFMHVPGIRIAMPSTPYDAKGLLKTAIRDDNFIMFIEHKLLYRMKGPVPEGEYTIPLGIADIKKEGKDVTIIATSLMVHKSLAAAQELEKVGISAEVVDPRCLNPLDKKTIVDSVKKTGRVVIVHEACKTCGVGAEIAAVIMEEAFDYLDAPIKRVAAMDSPVPYSKVLEDFIMPNENKIIQAVKEIV